MMDKRLLSDSCIFGSKSDIKRNDQRHNHRGISVLSNAGKILAWLPLGRLYVHVEANDLIPESHCEPKSHYMALSRKMS